MRAVHLLIAVAAGALANIGGMNSAGAVCSVFDRHPCAPTVCSVFQRYPCIPEILPPIGQDLRLTIESSAAAPAPGEVATIAQAHHDGEPERPEQKVDTIRELFDLLRWCW